MLFCLHKRIAGLIHAAFMLLLAAGMAHAQSARLLKDVSPGIDRRVGTNPGPAVEVGDWVYFAGDDPTAGRELWKTDGTVAGTTLVKDIAPGIASSYPGSLTALDGALLFVACEQTHGCELWRSDGTEEGTVLVKDLRPGSESSLSAGYSFGSPTRFTIANGLCFFFDVDGELWRTDGTEEGTVSLGMKAVDLAALGQTLYFISPSSQLWKTDGTSAGTLLVEGAPPYVVSYDGLGGLASAGPLLFFDGCDPADGCSVWRTDGTAGGTRSVGSDIGRNLTAAGPLAFFSVIAWDSSSQAYTYQLWRSDGTTVGTVPLASPATELRELTAAGNLLYFAMDDPAHGAELWRSDGTPAGTRRVKDIRPGKASSGPYGLTSVGDQLFLGADDGVHGWELWVVRGPGPGAAMVKDLWPGDRSSYPESLRSARGRLFFNAYDPAQGAELWSTDGTARGTVMLTRVSAPRGSGPVWTAEGADWFVQAGVHMFFLPELPPLTPSLWSSDGTPDGTQVVKGGATLGYSWGGSAVLDGKIFFSGFDSVRGWALWSSDGLPSGTRLVKDLDPESMWNLPIALASAKGALYFATFAPEGLRLWRSDGTAHGTVPFATLDVSWWPTTYVVNGIVFIVSSYGQGPGLWRTDGTASGTFNLLANHTIAYGTHPVDVGGTLFFSIVSDTNAGTELWRSDGTAQGTVKVRDLPANALDEYPGRLTAVGKTLYFVFDDGINGTELWRSDGTEAGAVMMKDIAPGAAGSYPTDLTNVDGVLYFAANDLVTGTELWRSDGTEAGTQLVKDILPGPDGSNPSNLARVRDRLLFAANDGESGVELWQSDGTETGTKLLADIAPGPASSSPGNIKWMVGTHGLAFFVADDGVHGREPWTVMVPFN